MNAQGHEYVIDNNALAFLKQHQRRSEFFQNRCHIPSEVLHEARGFPDLDELEAREYPTTGRVLRILIEIMATVPIGDSSLVDLYANRGNADPLVVACALDGQRASEAALFGPLWIVVSGDRAVQAKAAEFGVAVKSNDEFVAILEGDARNVAGLTPEPTRDPPSGPARLGREQLGFDGFSDLV